MPLAASLATLVSPQVLAVAVAGSLLVLMALLGAGEIQHENKSP